MIFVDPMKYFVWYSTAEHEGWSHRELSTEQEVLDFVNARAGNPEFVFEVVHGMKMVFKPVQVVTKYERG
jgi:hypothetical protein